MKKTARALILATILMASVLTLAVPAQATFPGANGSFAVASDRDGDWDIYTMSSATSALNLTNPYPGDDIQPAWSPTGNRIAFASNRMGNFDIYVMNPDGLGLAKLTSSPGADTEPAWSPDGSKLVFTSDRSGRKQLYVMTLGPVHPTTQLTAATGESMEAAWGRADGPYADKIAFASTRDGSKDIFVMNADGSDPVNLTQTAAHDGQPNWASATEILFQSNVDGDFEIYAMQGDGSLKTQLTNNTTNDTNPVRSPQGDQMAFVSDAGGSRNLRVAAPDGSSSTGFSIPGTTNTDEPDWRPRPVTLQLEQAVRNVVVEPRGTSALVKFDLVWPTSEPRAELWRNGNVRLKVGTGPAAAHWELLVDSLTPETTYDLKIVAKRLNGSWGTYTHPLKVKTLVRKVTLTSDRLVIHNDADAGTCGELTSFLFLEGIEEDIHPPHSTVCDGQRWDYFDELVLDHVTQDSLGVSAFAREDDTPAPDFDAWDTAEGSTTINLLDDAETFSTNGSVHLSPNDGALDITWHFIYSVSYHV